MSVSTLGVQVVPQASLVLEVPSSNGGILGLVKLIDIIWLLEGVCSVMSSLEDFVQNTSVVWLIVD